MARWIAIAALLVAAGCSKKTAEQPAPPADAGRAAASDATPAPAPADAAVLSEGERLIAAEMKTLEAARPVLEEHCAHCHDPEEAKSKKAKKALEHFRMGEYPYGGHHVGELGATVRKVLGAGDENEEATMPLDDPGSVEGEELAKVVAWTKALDAAREAGAGYHGERESESEDQHGGGDHHGH